MVQAQFISQWTPYMTPWSDWLGDLVISGQSAVWICLDVCFRIYVTNWPKTLQRQKMPKASPHPLQLAEGRLGDGEGCNESAENKMPRYVTASQNVSTCWHGYGSIPINTIFRGMNIQLYQLFWCSPGVQGFDTLPHLCGTSAFTVRTVGKQQYITSGNVFSTCTASIPATLITKIVTAVLSLQLNFKKLIPGVPLLKQCQIPSKSKVAFPHFERVNTWSQILALQGSNLLVPQKKDF